MGIDYSPLPPHMQAGMRRYIEHGIEPGSFLFAVLSNDLMGAMGKADDVNLYALPDYGRFLYNNAPANCFGSKENVIAWTHRGGLMGEASE